MFISHSASLHISYLKAYKFNIERFLSGVKFIYFETKFGKLFEYNLSIFNLRRYLIHTQSLKFPSIVSKYVCTTYRKQDVLENKSRPGLSMEPKLCHRRLQHFAKSAYCLLHINFSSKDKMQHKNIYVCDYLKCPMHLMKYRKFCFLDFAPFI